MADRSNAIVAANPHRATISSLAPQLLPLAGFAIVLPLLGIRVFSIVERRIRIRGELDLY